MRTLISLLQILNDFGDVLIIDDKKDIGTFSSPTHPSMVHHYQLGILIKMMTEMGMKAIDFLYNSMALEDLQQNASVHALAQMMDEAQWRRNAAKAERMKFMMHYVDMLKSPEKQTEEYFHDASANTEYNTPINITEIVNNRKRAQRVHVPVPALPETIKAPKVPKAPKL